MYLNGNGLIYTKELAWYISCNVDYVLVEYLLTPMGKLRMSHPLLAILLFIA